MPAIDDPVVVPAVASAVAAYVTAYFAADESGQAKLNRQLDAKINRLAETLPDIAQMARDKLDSLRIAKESDRGSEGEAIGAALGAAIGGFLAGTDGAAIGMGIGASCGRAIGERIKTTSR